jgi:hypothetical protein
MPSASSGKKNPFPSLLPPGIRSSGCGSGRSLPTLILQPAIDYIFDISISPAQCVKYSCGRKYIIIIAATQTSAFLTKI